MEKKTFGDKIRKNVVQILVMYIIPIGAWWLFIKIVGIEIAMSNEFGLLIGAVILIITAVWTKMLYEYLFPKYSDDVSDIN